MAKRIHRPRSESFTPEQIAEHNVIRRQFAHKPSVKELLASGEIEPTGASGVAEMFLLIDVAKQLKPLREAAGLSLTEMSARTGIDKAALSKLENEVHSPTLETIKRYLTAIGKRAVLQIVNS